MYYALFLSVVFALILGGFILLSGFNQNLSVRADITEILIDNAHSGMAYGQVNFQELKNSEPLQLRLFNNGPDSVEIKKSQWGAYTVLKSTALHKNQRHTKVALFGGETAKAHSNLFLIDRGKPLSICGNTRLEGRCLIPKAGLKRAYIEGKNYQGAKMLYGEKSNSGKQLPEVNSDFISNIRNLSGQITAWEMAVDSIRVSFLDEAIHYISDYYIDLSDKNISGQVIIEARDSVFIAANSEIENVIIKSPVIYVESGFKGNAQLFASNKIILENEVQLSYPSVIGLVEEEFATDGVSEIVIGEQSQVIGSVFLLSEKPNFRKLPQLTIQPKSEIDGLVYCQGRTQLKGTVNGFLYTDRFYLKTAASSYENHILDGKIIDQLPDDFTPVNLLSDITKLERIEWLN